VPGSKSRFAAAAAACAAAMLLSGLPAAEAQQMAMKSGQAWMEMGDELLSPPPAQGR